MPSAVPSNRASVRLNTVSASGLAAPWRPMARGPAPIPAPLSPRNLPTTKICMPAPASSDMSPTMLSISLISSPPVSAGNATRPEVSPEMPLDSVRSAGLVGSTRSSPVAIRFRLRPLSPISPAVTSSTIAASGSTSGESAPPVRMFLRWLKLAPAVGLLIDGPRTANAALLSATPASLALLFFFLMESSRLTLAARTTAGFDTSTPFFFRNSR